MNDLLKANKTAFYLFNTETAKKRIAYLRDRLPDYVDLCYAIKANTFIVKELIDDVARFEICSPGETVICNKLGVPSDKTVISGVYKTPDFIEELVCEPCAADRIYTVESMTQFDLLCSLSDKYSKNLKVLLRLTNDSQFGINGEDIEGIIANRSNYKHIKILGIQFFSGTQKTSVKKLKREITHLDALLLKLRDEYGYEAEELEYGPGFPVCYFEGEEFNEDEMLSEFSTILDGMTYKLKITLELGRSIAACCGRYYTHIVDIKHNKGQNYALIDGGMHHIVYFGQHMAMKHPILSVCDKESTDDYKLWNICGSLCSMNDIVAKQVPLPNIEIGDIICFENTGAYCMTEGISLFLSRDLPAVYLCRENGDIICVRRSFETSELNLPNYERN